MYMYMYPSSTRQEKIQVPSGSTDYHSQTPHEQRANSRQDLGNSKSSETGLVRAHCSHYSFKNQRCDSERGLRAAPRKKYDHIIVNDIRVLQKQTSIFSLLSEIHFPTTLDATRARIHDPLLVWFSEVKILNAQWTLLGGLLPINLVVVHQMLTKEKDIRAGYAIGFLLAFLAAVQSGRREKDLDSVPDAIPPRVVGGVALSAGIRTDCGRNGSGLGFAILALCLSICGVAEGTVGGAVVVADSIG